MKSDVQLPNVITRSSAIITKFRLFFFLIFWQAVEEVFHSFLANNNCTETKTNMLAGDAAQKCLEIQNPVFACSFVCTDEEMHHIY